MNEQIWYLRNGDYLEGDEAYEYVKELNKQIIDLHKIINMKLDGIKEYLEEYDIKETQEYENMYQNIMEAGERCSTTAILLRDLADYIDRRI